MLLRHLYIITRVIISGQSKIPQENVGFSKNLYYLDELRY